MANNDVNKKVPLPSEEVREKLINPDFLKPSSVPDMRPDISNASPVPMVTENPADPGRTRPASDEEILDNVTKSHAAHDRSDPLGKDQSKSR